MKEYSTGFVISVFRDKKMEAGIQFLLDHYDEIADGEDHNYFLVLAETDSFRWILDYVTLFNERDEPRSIDSIVFRNGVATSCVCVTPAKFLNDAPYVLSQIQGQLRS